MKYKSYSSTLAWRIPWMEEPGRLQSTGSLRIRHDWATSLSLFTLHWRRKWQPTPLFLPGESQGWGAWWAAVYAGAQSRTRLKRLSSSSSSSRICTSGPVHRHCPLPSGATRGHRPHINEQFWGAKFTFKSINVQISTSAKLGNFQLNVMLCLVWKISNT